MQVAEPETRYDPVRVEEQLFKQPVKWLVRNVQLFVPLGTFVAKVLVDIQVRNLEETVLSWSKYYHLQKTLNVSIAHIALWTFFSWVAFCVVLGCARVRDDFVWFCGNPIIDI